MKGVIWAEARDKNSTSPRGRGLWGFRLRAWSDDDRLAKQASLLPRGNLLVMDTQNERVAVYRQDTPGDMHVSALQSLRAQVPGKRRLFTEAFRITE